MKQAKHKMGPGQTRALFSPETFNEKENTIELVFATEAPVKRYDYYVGDYNEVLALENSAVRLERFLKGSPVLKNHDRSSLDSVLGVVTDAWIKENQGHAKIQFSSREDIQPIIQDIKAGVLRNVSVGYLVHKYMDISLPDQESKTLRAVDWEPYEVSFVPVPADSSSQVRSMENLNEVEIISREDDLKVRTEGEPEVTEPVIAEPVVETPVVEEPVAEPVVTEPVVEAPVDPEAAVVAEQERCLGIQELGTTHGLKATEIREFITQKKTLDNVREIIINKIAGEKASMQTQNTNVTIEADEKDKKRGLVELAISAKIGAAKGEMSNEVAQMRNLSLVEMAKELNPALRMMSKRDVALRSMHTTGDFPLIFGNVANKSLRNAYSVAPKTFEAFTRKVTLADYKEVTRIQLGSAPELKQIAEGGEYEYGTIGEGAEKYKLSKFGRKIRLTDEMFVNDDLDALSRLPALFGATSARLESKIVYAILTGSHMMADSLELFHASHKNLGTAALIGESSLDDLFTKIAEQKNGDDLLNLIPSFLVVGHKNRMAAQKFLASVTANKAGDVNVFQNTLQLIVDANISGKEYFGICSPDQVDTIETAYLEGMEGPEVKSIVDEANDSVILKCKHIFAAKAVDFRGMYKNPGL